LDTTIAAPPNHPLHPLQGASPGFSGLLDTFRGVLEREIAAWLAAKRHAAGSTALRELIDALEQLMANGGKRLRPALVYHTYLALAAPGEPRAGGRESAGDDGRRAVLTLALATEFLHSYLLIHDDIMDHAAVRRGQPSAHVRFRDAHLAGGLAGDADDFGRSAAILLGDLAHTYAVELFTSLGPAAAGGELARCFSAMCEEVIGGQYLEMQLAHRGAARGRELGPPADPRAAARETAPGNRPEEHRNRQEDPGNRQEEPRKRQEERESVLAAELTAVLRLKSGRYTAERPIQLGALLAGAPPLVLALLSAYGCAVGEAFQLQDDLLGMFGDAGAVGKPVGADLREGKFTFLIHHALAAASEDERRTIEGALGRADASDEEVERVRGMLTSTGARAAVEAMVEERLERARAALAGLSGYELQPAGQLFLAGLLDYLRERKR
jgi:geranylgeranyl diphosphate synthase type I